ncbi:PDR/VanB family oxidoreductase [Denitrobaculum tricleocarpae]|uniref:Oxidoreductase n=1 Tax=Denitrobaculum tricleocarpae TaxID=2591009 RepID=A0A545TQM6_9PROT|nr:PDR/VanB family oxidoreductase [Denitrobaculum tricleocarpae]TQV79526.1 oxidoreductase [Denitrobaculum tricleocarpae]
MSTLELKVIAVTEEAPMVRSFELASTAGDDLPGYSPGSHIRVSLPNGDDRPYSLVNLDPGVEPTQGGSRYRLGVRLEEASQGGSSFMHGLKPGDRLSVTLPKNDFALIDGPAPVVLMAGGIGITPIASMASALLRQKRDFILHYSGRAQGSLAFIAPLRALLGEKLIEHYDDLSGGYLDAGVLLSAADPESHLYVCGPKPMIEAVQAAARQRGWPEERIHFELFTPPVAQTGDKPFEVEIASSGESFTVPVGKSIIEVLEAAGQDLIYDCQRGDCGICQTDVISGEPDHRDVVLTDSEKASGKVMQICVSRAHSAKLVLDL